MNGNGVTTPAPVLCVSRDGRRIERADGTPFFYLGDTAWQLFHRLDREEADRYLENRAQKGFTVIQCVVLAELGGLDVPNAYGDLPLVDRDSARPNEGYMRHVDYVVDCAQALGLTVAMLPTWGSHWKRVGAAGPYLFDRENARAFGRIVGCRYREKPVIWVLGGDQDVESDAERAIIEAMAEGLDEGDGGRHLMTYHPRGPGRSSDVFHAAPWLDVNMIQSSHGAHDHDNGLFVEHDYGLEPPKPTLDGEPRYETLPVGFYHRDVSRLDRFDAYDVRQAAYWALLAGACGHTYGNNSVWQMWAPGRKPVLWADIPWWEALDHPGAAQMGLLRRLFESYAWHKLVPAPSAIVAGPQAPGARVRAACATDGSFLFAYSPRGEPFALDRRVLEARRVRETWFDPRYGSSHWVHTGTSVGVQTYAPPTSGRGNDWVLILEDAEGARAEPALGGDPGPGG